MWHKIIDNWKIIVAVIIIVLVPILLNYILLLRIGISEQWLIGDSESWLSFWGTYIGSIGTLLMVFITYKTLKQNNEQLNELKRQWEEEHRPQIVFSIFKYRGHLGIRIKNSGKRRATNIRITFNEDFINAIFSPELKRMIKNIENGPFSIDAGESKHIIIGTCDDIHRGWRNKGVIIKIKGDYCSNKYKIDETFCMDDYLIFKFAEVKDALWEIADGISSPNSKHKSIQTNLDIIAKQISRHNGCSAGH